MVIKSTVDYYNKASIITEYLEYFKISNNLILLLSWIPFRVLFYSCDNMDSISSIINKSGLISRFNLCNESIYITNRLFCDKLIVYCFELDNISW